MAKATDTGRRLTADVAGLMADAHLRRVFAEHEHVPATDLIWYHAGTLQIAWLLLHENERIIWRGRHLQPRDGRNVPFQDLAEATSLDISVVQHIDGELPRKIFLLAWGVGHGFAGLPVNVLSYLRARHIYEPDQLPERINAVVGSRGFGLERYKALEAWWNLQPERPALRLNDESKRKLRLSARTGT